VKFSVHATAAGSRARAGVLDTGRDRVATPVFMPVGTRGTVRTQPPEQLAALAAGGAKILLANTYHLGIRPGIEVFERFGGLRRWMGWPHSILTDSGGFQIFSLPGTTVDDAGARLRRPDGRTEVLTPERSIAIQRAIGADIMMVLDHCVASTAPRGLAEAAMQRTHRWAVRSRDARGDARAAMFAIVQGACDPELRRISADVLTGIGFDGYAIGGLAVGEPRAERQDTTELTTALLPIDRPRYLMGVGMPIDLLEGVHRGIDLFDCILPTALAQQGIAFTRRGRIDLARGVHRLAERSLDPACSCPTCTQLSRSYLHHLIKCQEPVGWQLLAFHNLAFYGQLMADIRARLADGTFPTFYAAERVALAQGDPDHPPGRPPRPKPRPARSRGRFALCASPSGLAWIRHIPSGEILHADSRAGAQAARRHIAQSALLARALAGGGDAAPRPALVVWDVGLGAAHHAMALVRAVEDASALGHDGPPPIELISFERDLDGLRLALDHVGEFPHLRHRAPHLIAHRGRYRDGRLGWTLCEGDFLATFAAQPPPDVVLYDPCSAGVAPELWSLATFRRLFAHVDRPVELLSYASSTAIRSALLAAGFHVARGAASGPRPETTIALTRGAGHHPLLDRAWLARRACSADRFPADVPASELAELEQAISDHPQFADPA
jgi:queuine tRNA-ribosyltransferase